MLFEKGKVFLNQIKACGVLKIDESFLQHYSFCIYAKALQNVQTFTMSRFKLLSKCCGIFSLLRHPFAGKYERQNSHAGPGLH